MLNNARATLAGGERMQRPDARDAKDPARVYRLGSKENQEVRASYPPDGNGRRGFLWGAFR